VNLSGTSGDTSLTRVSTEGNMIIQGALMNISIIESKISGELNINPIWGWLSGLGRGRTALVIQRSSVNTWSDFSPLGDKQQTSEIQYFPQEENFEGFSFQNWNPRDYVATFKKHASLSKYNSGFYATVADYLHREALYSAEKEVRYLGHEKDEELAVFPDSFIFAASRILVGYGLYVERAFVFMAAIFVIAWLSFWTAPKTVISTEAPRSWFFFTLDCLIPVVKLDKDFDEIRFRGWRQYVLYVTKLGSGVLAFLVLKVVGDLIFK
jgi:hypothetical protein